MQRKGLLRKWASSSGQMMTYADQSKRAEPYLTSESDIVRELRRLRFRQAGVQGKHRAVRIVEVARMARLHRDTIYTAINTGRISEGVRARLSPVLSALSCVGNGIELAPPSPIKALRSGVGS
jgi:hypothetical protein